jgi:hypothetical protein
MARDMRPSVENLRLRIVKLTKFATAVTLGVAVAAIMTTIGSHAYVTYDRWAYSPVPFYLNPNNVSVSADAAEAAVVSSSRTWTSQSRASFSFSYAGRVADTDINYDGRNVVILKYDPLSGGVLGSTYTYSSGGKITESDAILFVGTVPYFTGTSPCVNGAYIEDIATHEFGHALGLLHTGYYPATMYPYYYTCSMSQRNLSADDIAGVESLYPPVAGTPMPPTVTITTPLNGAAGTQGTAMSFAGTANDLTDGDLTSTMVWKSSRDGQLGSGGSLSAALSVGTHLITASAVDSGNLTGSSQISLTVTAPCARATPSVTLSPSTVSVEAGKSQAYTATVSNSDGSSCGASSFNLASTVQSGWSYTQDVTALALNPGSSGSMTLTVTAPATTPPASYQLLVGATNAGATAYSGLGSATETVTAPPPPPPVNTFTASVSTTAPIYVNGNTVIANVLVQNNGAPVASAAVTITMTRPNGTVQKITGNTSSTGLLKKTLFKVGNSSPRGTYVLNVTATKNGLSATTTTNFDVQ